MSFEEDPILELLYKKFTVSQPLILVHELKDGKEEKTLKPTGPIYICKLSDSVCRVPIAEYWPELDRICIDNYCFGITRKEFNYLRKIAKQTGVCLGIDYFQKQLLNLHFPRKFTEYSEDGFKTFLTFSEI